MDNPCDPEKPARDVLSGRVKREFPSEYLNDSLNDIKDKLRRAAGAKKRKLQRAKKLLEQQERLKEKDLGN